VSEDTVAEVLRYSFGTSCHGIGQEENPRIAWNSLFHWRDSSTKQTNTDDKVCAAAGCGNEVAWDYALRKINTLGPNGNYLLR